MYICKYVICNSSKMNVCCRHFSLITISLTYVLRTEVTNRAETSESSDHRVNTEMLKLQLKVRAEINTFADFTTSPQCKSTESQLEEKSCHQVCWTPVVSIYEWNDSENKWIQVRSNLSKSKINTYMIVYCSLCVDWLLDLILMGTL